MPKKTVQPEEKKSGFTPRKARADGGSRKQAKLRDEIAEAMRDEMLVCSVDGFLETLVPFSPSVQWIDNAYDHLRAKKLLKDVKETPTENSPSPGKKTRKKIKGSARGRTHTKARATDAGVQVDDEAASTIQWTAYCNKTPKQIKKSEMITFRPLEKIVQALRDCPDPDRNSTRTSNGYHYKDCPYDEMASEIMGAGFRVDAVIVNSAIYKEGEKVIGLAAAQTAVAMEFKKAETAESVYENRKQLVAAANHIMNDDPRRNWTYGITIEDAKMSLWYFSRSYSMKSSPFDFTKDPKMFIRVFLSFLYATDEELGHDPSIYRRYYDNKWCYVYKLETEEGPKYYRTVESLYNYRSFCITGRKSRVWKVVEVPSPEDLEPEPNKREVVLKDCWVDEESLSEKEIQTRIFERLKDVEEADYAWAPPGLRKVLEDGIACPERFFMKIEWDWKPGLNKEKPDYLPDSNLLSDPTEKSVANRSKPIISTQTPPPTTYPSPHVSHIPNPVATTRINRHKPRHYKVKEHYRVVYAEVGTSLASATSLSDAVRAFEDIFIALTLLFLARWVHRDVSEGNIILVGGEHGVRAKLTDLEYARFFDEEDEVPSADPKTGTPYFMPIEIHKGSFLFRKPASTKASAYVMSLNRTMIPRPDSCPPSTLSLRYNFAHDLESLWWVMVWIIVMRIKGGPWFYDLIFAVLNSPHDDREDFFLKGDLLHGYLRDLMDDTLCDGDAHTFLVAYNLSLCEFYASGKRQDATSYQTIYETVWTAMEYFVEGMSGISMGLENPHLRTPPPLPIARELRKRTRSLNNDGGCYTKTTAGEGSSRKKLKSGGDVLKDTDEAGTAGEDTI